MKKFSQKTISLLLSLLLVAYSSFGLVAPVLAEGETGTTTTTTTDSSQIDWNDPNNWYEKWTAERAARKAEAEAAAAEAAAAAAAATNSNTGADSTNSASTTTNSDTSVNVDNTASLLNVTSGEANTGESSSDKNTGDGSVVSGDAGLVANLSSDANKVSIGAMDPSICAISTCLAVSGEASNSNTGAGSENDASSESNSTTDVYIDNDLDVQNLTTLTANSGDNTADKNTGDGSVVTGDADLTLTAINVGNNVNVGAQVFNVMDDQSGDLILNFDDLQVLQTAAGTGQASSNDTTGAESSNTASATSNTSNTYFIDNNGNLVNSTTLDANTGDNSASKNTGDGTITTGDANVAVNVINFLNNTFLGGAGELLLGVVNVFGNLNGDIVFNPPPVGETSTIFSPESLNAANLTTGSDSANFADSSTNNSSTLGVNNTANVLNGINLNANTGDNTADKNTGTSSIQTGDVNANLKTATIANTTTAGSDGTLWLVLVNNLGNWTGQLMSLNEDGVASPFFSFVVGPDGSLMAVNNQTGADSSNSADSSANNTNTVQVNNSGTVDNNIQINANTGGNQASKNTGNASIKTGDVNVAANVLNILNNTFLGSRMIVSIVNIFGSFNGDIFPDGKPAENIGSTGLDHGKNNPSNKVINSILGSNTTTGSSNTGSNPGSTGEQSASAESQDKKSLVMGVSDNFGTPNITQVVNQASGGLSLRNLIFILIITAASAQTILKLVRGRWYIRKI
ncbi:MAG: hypothetical protein Q8P13_02265 [bacterium]|nr:hypothetical protein [bacterium]